MALENGSTTASDRVVVGVDGSPASLDAPNGRFVTRQ